MSSSDTHTNDQLHESLSALMDGESTELETRRLLKSDDPEILEQWHRYQLSSALLKGDLKGSVDIPLAMDISSSISAAIDAEPELSVSTKSSSASGFWSNVTRFGVAASVAGALVVGIQLAPTDTGSTLATSTPSGPVSTQSLSTQPMLSPDTSVRVVSQDNSLQSPQEQKQTIILNEATQQQLNEMKAEANRLMLEHAQNASQHTQQGVLPYVRVPESE